MKILKVILSLFLLGILCTEAFAQTDIEQDALYKAVRGTTQTQGYAASRTEDIMNQAPIISPFIDPKGSDSGIDLEESFKDSAITRAFSMPQPVTGMSQTFKSTDYLTVLNNNLGTPLSLWHIAQIQTEPAVAAGFNAARSASADIAKITYMAEDNFRQSMDLYPETRENILANLNGCINIKTKAGESRQTAVLKCFGDNGAAPAGTTALAAGVAEAFNIRDHHPEGINGATSVLISDMIFSRLGTATAPGTAAKPTAASGNAAALKQSFLDWFGDYKFEYTAATATSSQREYNITKIAPKKKIKEISDQIIIKRYEDLGIVLTRICEEELAESTSTDGANPQKYKGALFDTVANLQFPLERLSMPGFPFSQALGEMLWNLTYNNHRALLKQNTPGDCKNIDAFKANMSMDVTGSGDKFHDQKLWYRKFIEFLAADQISESYLNMERLIAKAVSESGTDGVMTQHAFQLIYDLAGTRDLVSQRVSNRALMYSYIAELNNKIAKTSGAQGGNVKDAAATKENESKK